MNSGLSNRPLVLSAVILSFGALQLAVADETDVPWEARRASVFDRLMGNTGDEAEPAPEAGTLDSIKRELEMELRLQEAAKAIAAAEARPAPVSELGEETRKIKEALQAQVAAEAARTPPEKQRREIEAYKRLLEEDLRAQQALMVEPEPAVVVPGEEGPAEELAELRRQYRQLETELKTEMDQRTTSLTADLTQIEEALLGFMSRLGDELRAQRETDGQIRAQEATAEREVLEGFILRLRTEMQGQREAAAEAWVQALTAQRVAFDELREETRGEIKQAVIERTGQLAVRMEAEYDAMAKFKTKLEQDVTARQQVLAEAQESARAEQMKELESFRSELLASMTENLDRDASARKEALDEKLEELGVFAETLAADVRAGSQEAARTAAAEAVAAEAEEFKKMMISLEREVRADLSQLVERMVAEVVAAEQDQLRAYSVELQAEIEKQRAAEVRMRTELAAATGKALGEFKSRISREMKETQKQELDALAGSVDSRLVQVKKDLEAQVRSSVVTEAERLETEWRNLRQASQAARAREAAAQRAALREFSGRLAEELKVRREVEAAARQREIDTEKQRLSTFRDRLQTELNAWLESAADAKTREAEAAQKALEDFRRSRGRRGAARGAGPTVPAGKPAGTLKKVTVRTGEDADALTSPESMDALIEKNLEQELLNAAGELGQAGAPSAAPRRSFLGFFRGRSGGSEGDIPKADVIYPEGP